MTIEETQQPVTDTDDAFSDAMTSAFADPAPVEAAPAPAEPVAESPAADDLSVEPAPAAETTEPAAESTEPPPAGETTEPAPAVEAPEPESTPHGVMLTDDQFRQILASVPGQKPEQPQPAPATEPAPVTLDSFMTDDERALVTRYEDEWSDVAKAEAIRRRAEMQLQQHQIYSEVAKALAPLTEVIREVKVKTHFDTIRAAHPDMDQVLPGLQAWVDQQPASLKGVFSQVIREGTAEQVVDLVSAYKKTVSPAAAPVPPAQAGTPSAPPVAAVPPTQPAARPAPTAAAVAATAAVGMGKRTAVSPGADSNDFDGAFAEALGI